MTTAPQLSPLVLSRFREYLGEGPLPEAIFTVSSEGTKVHIEYQLDPRYTFEADLERLSSPSSAWDQAALVHCSFTPSFVLLKEEAWCQSLEKTQPLVKRWTAAILKLSKSNDGNEDDLLEQVRGWLRDRELSDEPADHDSVLRLGEMVKKLEIQMERALKELNATKEELSEQRGQIEQLKHLLANSTGLPEKALYHLVYLKAAEIYRRATRLPGLRSALREGPDEIMMISAGSDQP